MILCLALATLISPTSLVAREFNPAEDMSITPAVVADSGYTQDMKVAFLTKLLDQQQKAYESRISFLESELRKTKERLITKSMNQEKFEEEMMAKHHSELMVFKRELAYKTKSLLEYQRQMEKMKPSEDLKNIIRINTELASELRRSEDQIAVMQLKQMEVMPGKNSGSRLPASVKEGK